MACDGAVCGGGYPDPVGAHRLHDVVHTDRKLTLVFEYLDYDLKKFLDLYDGNLPLPLVRVSPTWPHPDKEVGMHACLL